MKILYLDCSAGAAGEEIGFAMDSLFMAGAVDVFTQPIQEK